MNRDRFVQALRACQGVKGSSITIRSIEARILADLLEEPTTPPSGNVDYSWLLFQYQTALGMLAEFGGDTLVERVEAALSRLTHLERWKALALGSLAAITRDIEDARRAISS